MAQDPKSAAKIIGYTFRNASLLRCALTHKSFANEYGGESNGRLEYLGDSVLNLIVAELLYRATPEEEGVLTELRQHIVSREPLAAAVREMGLLSYYRLGRGAQENVQLFGVKPTSDVFESVLGAIYLDGGMESARVFVQTHLLRSIEQKSATQP